MKDYLVECRITHGTLPLIIENRDRHDQPCSDLIAKDAYSIVDTGSGGYNKFSDLTD